MPTACRVAAALVAFASLSAPAAAASVDRELLDRPDAKWRNGPARYLLTKDEEAAFKKLKAEPDRAAFIEAFWAKRDPSPGTPENEFKDLYVRRLEVVAERFGPPDGRGWEEDRGKIVLLLGAPDEQVIREPETRDVPEGGIEGAGSTDTPRRRASFVYKHEVLPGLEVPLKLDFIEDSSGGYRLQSRIDLQDPRLLGTEFTPIEPPPAASAPAPPEALPEPTPAPPTPQRELMDAIVDGPTPAAKIPLMARVDTYKTSTSDSLATITLTLKKAGSAAPIVAARVLRADQEPEARLEAEESFAASTDASAAKPGDEIVLQAERNLPPGKYTLVAGAKDTESGDVGFLTQSIEVPDYAAESFAISSITLASAVERLTGGASGENRRYVLGNYRVVPAPRPQFKAGQDLWLYFQIYNSGRDPGTQKSRLKVSYRFEKIEKTRNVILGGKPIDQLIESDVSIFSVAVQPAWPAGAYQVVVTVADLVSGGSAGGTIPFTVVK